MHISNVLMSGQQHALAACLGSMEVIVNSPSFLFVNLVSFNLSLAKINPITFTGDKVLEKEERKIGSYSDAQNIWKFQLLYFLNVCH